MVLLGSNGEKYIPAHMPTYKPAPVKVAAKKPTTTAKKTTTTKKPTSSTYKAPTVSAGSRVVSSRTVTPVSTVKPVSSC
jgi:hypothetical protein